MLEVEDFLREADKKQIIDVRSPSEFAAGHIPGARNIPLFEDNERAIVGTLYKQAGREASILKGLEFVGPKLAGFVQEARRMGIGGDLLMNCWRGGMRSENMAWLFRLAGYHVDLLEGGYKAYRRYIREKLSAFNNIVVLGGKTGSGKTQVLDNLSQEGYQVLNLEEIAHHKGSAFGDLGQQKQPSTEQFENNLYRRVSALDPTMITFVEDESRGIGRLSVPDAFYSIMRCSVVIFMDVPKHDRINRLVDEYAVFPKERLASAIQRIGKKLGGQNVNRAIEALNEDDFYTVADILLNYYDKAYLKGLSIRDQTNVYRLELASGHAEKNAKLVRNYYLTRVIQKQ